MQISKVKGLVIDSLLEIIAPHGCLRCAREGKLLCPTCVPRAITRKGSTCVLCNRLTDGFKTCANCRRRTALTGVIVASHYDGDIKSAIQLLKYHRTLAAANILGDILAEYTAPANFDIITAAPINSRHFRQRGYSQSALIAKRLARKVSLPYANLLNKTGTTRQVGTARKLRWAQISGTVFARQPYLIKNQRILIVDDVVTTGATLSECAAILKQAGAKNVWGAAVAKH